MWQQVPPVGGELFPFFCFFILGSKSFQRYSLPHLPTRTPNRRDAPSLSSDQKMGKHVAFIRHGEAVHNPHLQASKKETDPDKKAELYAKGISFLDPELTEKGVKQAEGLRDGLEGENKTYDVVVVSPLRRTIQTAHIALSGRATLFVIDPESTETADPIWGLPQRVRLRHPMLVYFIKFFCIFVELFVAILPHVLRENKGPPHWARAPKANGW